MRECGAILSVFLERRYITAHRLEYDSQMSCGRFMQIRQAAVGGPLESYAVTPVVFFWANPFTRGTNSILESARLKCKNFFYLPVCAWLVCVCLCVRESERECVCVNAHSHTGVSDGFIFLTEVSQNKKKKIYLPASNECISLPSLKVRWK